MHRIAEVRARKTTHIVEIVNGLKVSDTLFQRLDDAARVRLQTFFKMLWPHFSGQTHLMHEHLDSFNVDDVRVQVQVDLATRSRTGEFVISDWKTGRAPDPDEAELQMGTYALWANAGLGEPLSRIVTQVVNLRTGQFTRRTPDQDLLARVRMQLLAEARAAALPLDRNRFAPAPSLEKCLACRHLAKCPEGRRELASREPLSEPVL